MHRIANEVVVDIETGEVLHASYFEWNGQVALCKGGNSQAEMKSANEIKQQELGLMQQALANQQGQINQVNPINQQILANGGMLPQQQAAMTSLALNSLPQQYQNLQGQLNNQLVQRGVTGGQNAGGGAIGQQFGWLGAQEANQQANMLSQIQLAKGQGLQNAFGTALGIGNMYGGNTGLFNQGALSALGQGVTAANNADQAQTGFWGSLVGGLAGLGGQTIGAAGRAGGFSSLFS